MGFSLTELILVIILPYLVFRFAPTTLVNRLPQITRLPFPRSHGFHRASGTIRLSDYSHGIASHFAYAYRVTYSGASRKPCESSWGHSLIFPTVPPANTLVRWVDENAFASILQARPCPTFGRPVRPWDGSLDYGPVFLRKPFGFHLTMDTLSSGCLSTEIKLRCIPLSVSTVSGFVPYLGFSLSALPGQRGVTPAFGYDTPHPGARRTLTLLISALPSAHYGRSDSCPAGSSCPYQGQ